MKLAGFGTSHFRTLPIFGKPAADRKVRWSCGSSILEA
jgi:hypothetical protein